MSPLRAIIIDDEEDGISLLQLQLSRHCPDIRLLGAYTNPQKALIDIPLLKPDLLFLDIEMPSMSGFELLNKLSPAEFHVIFITAYNNYAVKAFRFNAVDYLVKPFETDDLINAVNKVHQCARLTTTQLELISRQLRGEPVGKIAIPGQNGVSFVDLDEIIYVEASNNYSKLMLKDGRVITISKTMKDVQDILEESHFLRIHRQYIVNLTHLKHYNRKDSVVTLDNKVVLPVGRNQGDRLMNGFNKL